MFSNDIKKRYINALLILGLLACFAFLAQLYTVEIQDGYEKKINMSGRQRMLSQKITKLTLLYSSGLIKGEKLQKIKQQILKDIQLMADSHKILTEGSKELRLRSVETKRIEAIYYGERSLDKKVNEFLEIAKTAIEKGKISPQTITSLIKRSEGQFLADLDYAVSIYEQEAADITFNLKMMFLAILLITILVLIFEYVLIFKPMEEKITEYNEQLEDSLEEMTEKNLELSHFTFLVSHDLKEPVRNIINAVDMLERFVEFNDRSKKIFENLKISTRFIHELTIDLVNFINLGKEEIKMTEFNAERAVYHAIINLDLDITEKDAEITYSQLPLIEANYSFFCLLFQNLISNSIKYIKPYTRPLINISCKKENDLEYIFCIQDNGIGIAEDYYQKIFEPLKRLNRKADYPGSGMGLSICKKIVEIHKGRIWVESEVGKGTAFYFSIPKSTIS